MLGSVALGLALGTKFTAVLALPVVVAIVAMTTERGHRRRPLLACAAGLLLGAPWYVLNLAETGSFDGGLRDATRQAAELSPASVLGTLRALSFDVVDVSGIWQSELLVPVAVGGVLAAAWLFLEVRSPRSAPRTLLAAGVLVAATPLVLRGLEWPAREAWQQTWSTLGREDIAFAHGDAWKVLSLPDTSLSWYGAAGAIVVVAGGIAAVIRAHRGDERPATLLFALAPVLLVAIFAFAITYDPWRGRLLIFGVGLACAAWGWTLRARWLAVGMAALCITTVGLSLVHAYTKPFWSGALEPPILASIWHRDRIDELTVVRDYDGTPALLRAVEKSAARRCRLAVATPMDAYLAPLAGPHLSRTSG